jgi:hypothetical protein
MKGGSQFGKPVEIGVIAHYGPKAQEIGRRN